MTAAEFARTIDAIPARLVKEVTDAEAETLQEARRVAVKLSSGTLTTAELRRRGHPYARRRPTARNSEVVNAQRGIFRSSWAVQPPRRSAGGVVSRLSNTSGEAKYLLGTRTAIYRPIREAIIKNVGPVRITRLRAAINQALTV